MSRTADTPSAGLSLRNRLLVMLLAAFLLLSLGLYSGTRAIAEAAADRVQDHTLAASLNAVAEQLSVVDGEVSVDLPYAALALLGAGGDDRVFYRVSLQPGGELTGYADLPHADTDALDQPRFQTRSYRGDPVRIASTRRAVFHRNGVAEVTLSIAQSRDSHTDIIDGISRNAAALGAAFLLSAIALAWFAIGSALAPLGRLSDALHTRRAHDTAPLALRVPREIAPVVGSLNGFLQRLRTTLSNTETLIADAAHRVRTPLTAVKAQAQLALRHAEHPTQRDRLRNLLRAVDQTARSTDQILDHAMVTFRSDSVDHAAQRERTDMVTLMQNAITELRYAAEQRDITLQVSVPDTPPALELDPILVTEALRNVIDNAIKYSPAESVVTLCLTAHAGRVDIAVADRGCGIAEGESTRVRERFVRGSNAGNVVGSGLGLTIVQQVMEAHKGSLVMSERDGGGTVVTLGFPEDRP
ncbi:MAG: sensor histidine kinase N-terminal domain-containing protein [Pseudomonadota bacterium]